MSRLQAPQVSLRERIAALQQREAGATSPNGHGNANNTGGATNHPGALRDKIAKFEKEGAVPAPRGSFGMGAPPLVDNGQSKRRGELYGNRIPSVGRPPNLLPPPTRRLVSLSDLDTDDAQREPRQFRSFSPLPLDVDDLPRTANQHKPRSPSFASALDIARKAEIAQSDISRANTPSPGLFGRSPNDEAPLSPLSDETSSEMETTLIHSGSDIAVHMTGDSIYSQKYHPVVVVEEEEEEEEDAQEEEEITSKITDDAPSRRPDESIPEDAHPPSTEEASSPVPTSEDTETDASTPHLGDVDTGEPERQTMSPVPTIVEEFDPPAAATPGPTTAPPLPDDTDSEEDHATRRISAVSQFSDDSLFTTFSFLDGKSKYSDMMATEQNQLPDSPFVIEPYSQSTPQRSQNLDPLLPRERPQSMMPSPTHATHAHRMSKETSTGIGTFVPPSTSIPGPVPEQEQEQEEQYPRTPSPTHNSFPQQGPVETEFGVVSLHKPSHSFSHPHAFVSHYAEQRSFNAVVHGKVREVHATMTPVRQLPQTPQMNRVRRTGVEPPPSPGSSDLAALMQEAARLEQSLMNGELPSEAPAPVPQPKAEEPTVEPVVAPREPVLPPQKRHKRTFKIPSTLGRTKSGHSRAESSGYTSSQESGRTMPSSWSRSGHESQDDHSPPLPSSSMERPPSIRASSSQYSTVSTLQPTPEDEVPPTPPPKSPSARYLGTFKRFATKRSSVSVSSELSSDDSIPVVTPPESSVDFAGSGTMPVVLVEDDGDRTPPANNGAGNNGGGGGGVAWPSISPQKTGSMSRASSFADRIWHRGRAKSGASMVSTTDDDVDRGTLSSLKGGRFSKMSMSRRLSTPKAPKMSTKSVPPSPELPTVIVPPARSHSLHSRSQSKLNIPPLNTLPNGPLSKTFEQPSSSSSRQEPSTPHRPVSWASNTSASPSTVMGEDFFNEFPSVPQDVPRGTSIDMQNSPILPQYTGPGSHPPVSAFNMHALSRTSSAATARVSMEHVTSMSLL